MKPLRPGVHLVHKPVGETSFTQVKRLLEERAAQGPQKRLPLMHGGTLDPFATGLLLLLAGEATHLFELLHALPKAYRATVTFGVETDTGDAAGREVARGDVAGLSAERIQAALTPFLGWHDQVPPTTSAKKIGGEPAYKKAHRGETFTLPASRVYLHRVNVLAYEPSTHHAEVELTCRGGFYVRSLVTELGRALGCRAHTSALVREQIGPWVDVPPGHRRELTGPDAVPWLPVRALSDAEWGRIRRGEAVGPAPLLPPAWSWPRGFPTPQPLSAGEHQGRVMTLLEARADGELSSFRTYRRGF